MDEESLRKFLECPICKTIVPDTEYFACQNGHTICANCHSKVKDCCPQCKSKYPQPATRQRIIEQMIDQQLEMELNCRNFIFGCLYVGKKAERVTHQKDCKHVKCFCPFDSCHVKLSHDDVVKHIMDEHNKAGIGTRICTSTSDEKGRAVLPLYPKLSHFKNSRWMLLDIVRFAKLDFLVIRRTNNFDEKMCWVVIVNASKEVAEGYKAKLRFGKRGTSQLTWIGHVFSTEDAPDSFWQSPGCLSISNALAISMLRPLSESEKEKANGKAHRLHCDLWLQRVKKARKNKSKSAA